MKTTVYNFRTWNGSSDETIAQPLKSTEARIKSVGGEVIAGTGEVVDAADLDEFGRYDPKRRLEH